jgi:hypothetical protein
MARFFRKLVILIDSQLRQAIIDPRILQLCICLTYPTP